MHISIEITKSSMKVNIREAEQWVAVFVAYSLVVLLNVTVVVLITFSLSLSASHPVASYIVVSRTRWKFEINGFVDEST